MGFDKFFPSGKSAFAVILPFEQRHCQNVREPAGESDSFDRTVFNSAIASSTRFALQQSAATVRPHIDVVGTNLQRPGIERSGFHELRSS